MVVSLLRKPPRKKIVENGITFRPYDIKGLLVKVIHTLPVQIEWIGRRFPDGPESDPSPSLLKQKLIQWNQRPTLRPFIMDTDHGSPVWNWTFDKVEVDIDNRLFKFTSTGFPEENRTYIVDWKQDAWIQEITYGGSKNPDFAWMVSPKDNVDVMQLENWPLENVSHMTSLFNPHISPRKVFQLYLKSIQE